MKIRCRQKEGKGHWRNPDFSPEPYMKFKCKWCKRLVCGYCEGTVDSSDPVGNKLCDTCWSRRDKKLKNPPYATRILIKIPKVIS